MSLALIILPLIAALLAFFGPAQWRRWLVPITGTIHLALTLVLIWSPEESSFGGWLLLDRLGKVFLLQTSLVYFLCSLYTPGYLALHSGRSHRGFTSAMLVLLGMISLHIQSHHLGLMWVALESLTLTCGPLVYFNRNPRSLEATWKYLLIGSVGVALALLGSFFLAYSALKAGLASSLVFDDLIAQAPKLSRPWLDSAFILLFVGYGTKMGLAPMHTWKPDAYGEAPGVVGALLAGCVTSCAYLAILRFYQICAAAGDVGFPREIMIAIGLLSMVVAGVFMARQRDYKRMLAYSSVEHMGILVLGIGIGGSAIFGALLHLINNGVTKGVLFLSAGNIHRAFGSKSTTDVGGAMRVVPASGVLFFIGFFAVTGSPPFCMFLSEFTILREAIISGQFLIAGLFLVMLLIIFVGMGATVLSVVQGAPPGSAPTGKKEPFLTVAPIVAFLSLALFLGLYIPHPLESLLRDAAMFLEARP
jgi:hydrogenase-4 component F